MSSICVDHTLSVDDKTIAHRQGRPRAHALVLGHRLSTERNVMDDNKYIDDFIIDEYIDTFPTVWKGEKTYHTFKKSIFRRIYDYITGQVS